MVITLASILKVVNGNGRREEEKVKFEDNHVCPVFEVLDEPYLMYGYIEISFSLYFFFVLFKKFMSPSKKLPKLEG